MRDLERRGWVERAITKEDARAYLLTLSRLGKRHASRLIKIFDSTQKQLEDAGGRELVIDIRRFVKTYRRTRNAENS